METRGMNEDGQGTECQKRREGEKGGTENLDGWSQKEGRRRTKKEE